MTARRIVAQSRWLAVAAMVAVVVTATVTAAPEPGARQFVVGAFSTAHPGEATDPAWRPLAFDGRPGPTVYTLVADGGATVVAARAAGTASGLLRELDLAPTQWPRLRWRWKLETLPRGADIGRREGDDYAARIYVTFAYDAEDVGLFERARFELLRLRYGHYPPRAALNYVWDAGAAVGTVRPNAYTGRVRMVVLESGPARAGEWVIEERDLLADFRHAFGYPPPRISGIAIMTDADDTGSVAAARYGDIELLGHGAP
ncbi:MAG: DUF3047 domain-containing protein [Gammaproteobacteria bacterium]